MLSLLIMIKCVCVCASSLLSCMRIYMIMMVLNHYDEYVLYRYEKIFAYESMYICAEFQNPRVSVCSQHAHRLRKVVISSIADVSTGNHPKLRWRVPRGMYSCVDPLMVRARVYTCSTSPRDDSEQFQYSRFASIHYQYKSCNRQTWVTVARRGLTVR